MSRSQLVKKLVEVVGREHVHMDRESLETHSYDGLRPYRAFPPILKSDYKPDVVVTPVSTLEVSRIIRVAYRHRAPVVPFGGGTGLMGGAIPVKGGIVVDLKKMNRIIQINSEDLSVTAQAGVILEDLDRKLSDQGLMIGHDPWTRSLATLGGAVSTNGLGYLGGKYGSIGDQVLAVEAVLPDGTVAATRPALKRSTGIDVTSLFLGAEGSLGLITEVTLRVFPRAESFEMAAYEFSDFQRGYRALMEIFRKGLVPAALDFGESLGTERALLLVFFDGLRKIVEPAVEVTRTVMVDHQGRELNRSVAEEFWRTRHDIAERYKQRVRSKETMTRWRSENEKFDFIHVWLPASKVPEYHVKVKEIMKRHAVTVHEAGVWNQPELYSMALTCKASTGKAAAEKLSKAVDEAVILAQDLGGTMEYCHGVGIRLAHLMEREHGNSLDIMRIVKKAIDPRGIMNPGKMALN